MTTTSEDTKTDDSLSELTMFVDFRFDHPLLRQTFERVPEMEVEWIQSDIVDDRSRVFVWVTGPDFEAFEAALEADPTVTTSLQMMEFGYRRLYNFELVNEGAEKDMYSLLVDEGAFIQHLRGTHEGWEFRIAFPDEEALHRLVEFASEHDIDFEVHRIFRTRNVDHEHGHGISEKQRDALLTALGEGYFDVPRTVTMDELADQFDISGAAMSQRIRRGMKGLLESVYASDIESIEAE